MFIRLEPSSAIPIYRQIVDQVKYQIASGSLRSGDRMPSVRELAARLPANQNTVLKAYDILSQEKLISRRQGEGTFVEDGASNLKKSERLKQLSSLLAQAAAQAVHFEITSEQLHELLNEEIQRISKGNKSYE